MAKELEFKNSPKPRQLDVKKWAVERGVEPPPFEAWRQGDFLITYYAELPGCVVVDVAGEMYFQRQGKLDVTFAIIDALYSVKLKGERLYALKPEPADDQEFWEISIGHLMSFMGPGSEIDEELEQEIYQSAREDLLNELIKPPKKDNPL
ncbi:MAG TPA: hypothetical protein VHO69_14450 [Phototrophicaceae bacterium]|nr:hypothetical protein [Phototrophicaceae bacterium]